MRRNTTIPIRSLFLLYSATNGPKSTTVQFSRHFISLFGVDHGSATSCLHSPFPLRLLLLLLCETNLPFPRGRKNQRDNFVGQ